MFSFLTFILTSNNNLLRWPAIELTQASETSNSSNSTPGQPQQLEQQATFRLDCQPGEQRQFSYESSTKVWGSSNQQVRLRAILQLRCMEPPTNTTLKYLAEIVSLEPHFVADQQQPELQSSRLKSENSAKDKLFHADSTNADSKRTVSAGAGKTGHPLRVVQLNNKRQQLVAGDKNLHWSII